MEETALSPAEPPVEAPRVEFSQIPKIVPISR
jgi:hypothetical protein